MTEPFILEKMRAQGIADALTLQENSGSMSGTELNAQTDVIPDFIESVKVKNMLDRPAGQTGGFVCRSSAGRVVSLLQKYDSTVYLHEDGTPWEPEELPAQWRFKWSTDPAKALPFIKLSTSPYDVGDCYTFNGGVYRSTINGNVYSPEEYPSGVEYLGTAEEVMA